MGLTDLFEERRGLVARLHTIQGEIQAAGHTPEPIILHHGGTGEPARSEWCHLPSTGKWAARLVQGSITQIIGVYDSLTEAVDASDAWRKDIGHRACCSDMSLEREVGA